MQSKYCDSYIYIFEEKAGAIPCGVKAVHYRGFDEKAF